VYPRNGTAYDSYTRSAGQTVKMSRSEVKQLIAKTHGICFEEQIAATGLSVDDVLNKLEYDSFFQLSRRNLPDGKNAIRDILLNEDLIGQDSQGLSITNPGAPLVDTNRFIDTAPKSRNESLASLLRRLNICEERGSGVDRAIDAIEAYQLPAPKFMKGDDYTRVIIFAPVPLSRMDSDDRIRACYQHCCLHHVNNQLVTNQTVRKRFDIPKNSHPMASRIVAETVESGLVKPANPESQSKKFANYIPYWA